MSVRHAAAAIAVAVCATVACHGPVRERPPSPSPLPPELLSNPATADLVRAPEPRELDLASPDGRYRLSIVSTGLERFYGVELQRDGALRTLPVLSLWERESGTGISLAVRWAADSGAVRLTGSTKGFLRSGGSGGKFDLLYVPDRDAFYEVPRAGERG